MTHPRKPTTAGPGRRSLETITASLSFPPVSEQLVSTLERLHPLRPPNPSQSDREIWMEVGRQEIITTLRNRVRVQPASIESLTEVNISEV